MNIHNGAMAAAVPSRPTVARPLTVLALILAACGGGAGGGAETAPPPPRGPGPAPPPGPTSLRPLGSEPRAGDGFAAWDLTGRNKPNGPQQRYRRWVPPETPAAIPRELDGLELWLADPADGGWITLYGRTASDWRQTAEYRGRFYGPGGTVRWDLDLDRFLSRDDLVEIQDLRYDDGALFFNEGCLTYARDADGRCSSLLRVDPARGEVAWRSRDLVSNDIFLALDQVLVTGYGFTAEPDSVFLLDRRSGNVLDARPLDSAHAYLELRGDTLHVVTRARIHRFLVR